MGIKRSEYIIVGVNLLDLKSEQFAENDETNDLLYQYIDEEDNKDFFCLYDSMNGKYILVGELIAVGDEFEGLDLTKLSSKKFRKISKKVKELLKEKLNIDEEPKFFAVTRWS